MSGETFHIDIPKWDRYQHYKDRKRPTWIKDYCDQLDDRAYLKLKPYQRAVLQDLRRLYATSGREVPDTLTSLSRRVGYRVTRASLVALNEAGFIHFTSRGTSRHAVPQEEEKEKEKEQDLVEKTTTPVDNFPIPQFGIGGDVVDITEVPRKKTNPDNRVRRRDSTSAYTGCKWVTGANGSGGTHIYDVLGIDFPPSEWPFARPSTAEVLAELERRRVA